MSRILNCVPSKDTESDWQLTEAVESGFMLPEVELPDAVDLRADWWTIGDQQTSGACVGFAVADSVCRWHFVQDGRLEPDQLLSVRYVWMAAKETDHYTARPTTFLEREGTSLKAALDVVRKYGIVTDALLPFAVHAPYQNSGRTFYATASRLRIASYFNLGRNLDHWRAWLATNGPILTRLDVDETWNKATVTNGVLDTYKAGGRGGHAVALVGYTPDYFIVRNSWGADWADHGYAYASPAYTAAAFTEAYGIAA